MLPGNLEEILRSIGLLGIWAMIFAESGLLVGFFLPGDSVLFTAGVLAADGLFNFTFLQMTLSTQSAQSQCQGGSRNSIREQPDTFVKIVALQIFLGGADSCLGILDGFQLCRAIDGINRASHDRHAFNNYNNNWLHTMLCASGSFGT